MQRVFPNNNQYTPDLFYYSVIKLRIYKIYISFLVYFVFSSWNRIPGGREVMFTVFNVGQVVVDRLGSTYFDPPIY